MKNKFYRNRNNRKSIGFITIYQFRELVNLPPQDLVEHLRDRLALVVEVYEYSDGMYVGHYGLYARINNPSAERIRGLFKYVEEHSVLEESSK